MSETLDPLTSYQAVMITVGIIGYLLAVASFGLLAPWYKSVNGVILFSSFTNILFLLGLIWSRIVLGMNYPYDNLVRDFVYTITAINGICLSVLVVRVQYKNRRRRSLSRSQRRDAPSERIK